MDPMRAGGAGFAQWYAGCRAGSGIGMGTGTPTVPSDKKTRKVNQVQLDGGGS